MQSVREREEEKGSKNGMTHPGEKETTTTKVVKKVDETRPIYDCTTSIFLKRQWNKKPNKWCEGQARGFHTPKRQTPIITAPKTGKMSHTRWNYTNLVTLYKRTDGNKFDQAVRQHTQVERKHATQGERKRSKTRRIKQTKVQMAVEK